MIYYFRYKAQSSAGKFYHIEPDIAYGWIRYPSLTYESYEEAKLSIWRYKEGWSPI